MSLCDLLGSDGVLHLDGQIQQPEQICDGGAVEPQSRGQLFLGATVRVEIGPKRCRLLERVQILALEVLDHRQLAHPLVVQLHDACWHFMQLSF